MAATTNSTRSVLEGALSDLPAQESNVVRIFLSSTFTDYAAERNAVTCNAVPELRKYCHERGLDFQVVDMRWGVRDDAQVDHQTTEMCLREVEKCYRISRGPSFVVLLGNKYGYRPYPNKIEENTFKILLESAKSLRKDTALLEEWFICDKNSVPPTYVLQPITSKFPYYNDLSEEHQDKRKQEEEEWNSVDTLITNTFRFAARRAFKDGRITEEQRHQYFQSVTENEVAHGILDVSDCNQRALCFTREFTALDTSDKKAGRYTDLEGGVEDEEAKELRDNLKQVKLPKVLSHEHWREFSLKWMPGGIDIDNHEHAEYLLDFTQKFINGIQDLIDASLTSGTTGNSSTQNQLYKEVLHHSHFVQMKSQNFCGREELLREVHNKLHETFEYKGQENKIGDTKTEDGENGESDSKKEDVMEGNEVEDAVRNENEQMAEQMGVNFAMEEEEISLEDVRAKAIQMLHLAEYRKPLVIYGSSGCGKTALMAMIAKMPLDWLETTPVKIIRFFGTSPLSASIKETIVSICAQIWATYDEKPAMELDIGKEYSFLVMYFNALLRKIDTKTKPLVIILDSVDQLNSQNYAHSMKWLPTVLPVNVYLVASMIPKQHGCLDNTNHVLEDPSRFVEVPALPNQTAAEILEMWGKHAGRTITSDQNKHVMEQFGQCPQPLFLKLAFQQAVTWKSYTPASEWSLGSSVSDAIHQLFDNLERDHGQVLVSKALGFLTAAKNGLSDAEIEDILSCDDEVLQDTYLYHLPPDENTIRLPPLLWQRIRFDLLDYLVERKADEKDMVTWYHRQFWETAESRYLTDDIRPRLHEGLVDYFSGKWFGVVKPLELYKKKIGSYPNANRQVASQPLTYGPGMYNRRKMSELPYHLVESGQYTGFVNEICRNFEWLYHKTKAASLDDVLDDFKLALSKMADLDGHDEEMAEIKQIRDVLVLASDTVRRNVNNLPIQILGQLDKEQDLSESLLHLRQQAEEWCEESSMLFLVPRSHCLPTVGSELQTNIEHILCFKGDEPKMECKLCLSKDGSLLYAVERTKSKAYKDDLRGDLLKTIDLQNSGAVTELQQLHGLDVRWLQLVGNDRYMIIDIYERRDAYSPKSHMVIMDRHRQEPLMWQPGEEVAGMSESGKFALVRKASPPGPTKEGPMWMRRKPPPKDGEEEKPVTVGFIVDLETQSRQPMIYNDVKILEGLFSPDDKHVVVSIEKGYLVWEVHTGRLLHSWLGEKEFSFGEEKDIKSSMKMLSNGTFVAPGTGYKGNTNLYLWDITSGELLKEFTEQFYEIDLIALNQDQSLAATASTSSVFSSGCDDKNIRVFDLREKNLMSVVPTNYIHEMLEFAGKYEEFILTATWKNHTIQVWHIGTRAKPLEKGVLIHRIVGHSEGVYFAKVTADGATLVTASGDNTIKLWDMARLGEKFRKLAADGFDAVKNGDLDRPFQPGEGQIVTTATAVARDGKTAVIGTQDGWVILYDLQTMKVITYAKQETKKGVSTALASRNGSYFVTTAGHIVNVWNPVSGELVRTLEGGPERIMGGSWDGPSCVAESQDLFVAGYAGMEGVGCIWNLNTGQFLKKLSGLYSFSQVVISSDASKVATTLFDYPFVFSVETGNPVEFNMAQMDTMMSGCTCLRLSDNDKFLVSCSTDGSVKVINMATAEYKFRMQHRSTVGEAAFSPDSSILLTAGFKNILVWSMQDGHLLHTLTGHDDFLYRLVFACDGQFLVSCSADKRIVVWKFGEKSSVASFHAHCPVRDITVAHDLSSVLYAPTNVAYLGVLKPNPILSNIISGEHSLEVSDTLCKAQALALAFSSQKVKKQTARSCLIL